MPAVRYWGNGDPETLRREAAVALQQERQHLARIGHEGPMPEAAYLAISGGGDRGAFGAGVLVGWTEAGTRPRFKVVTGVSTGALIAPFAFLGPSYDDQLRTVYTSVSAEDVFNRRWVFAAVWNDAMASTEPLRDVVREYVDEEMLRRIASEHRRGRRLLVGTTDLDSGRSVIWNMGAIATSGRPKALALFRSVLVASSAIPGVFPPVMFDVEIDGRQHQEMHVDGGVMAQVFLYPPAVSPRSGDGREWSIERERTLYVIRNSELSSDWSEVERSTTDIATRAVSTLIRAQGLGDLYRLYAVARRDHVDYKLAIIEQELGVVPEGLFDSTYMNALFDHGYELASHGYPWRPAPPGFDPHPSAAAATPARPRRDPGSRLRATAN